jgi:hypothetical protein
MNVNDMIDTILNFDLDVVLAGLNESSHHLSQMEFISLIVIMAGAVLLCLTGLKLVRFWSVIAGLSAGCAAGIAVGAIAGLDQIIALAAGAGVGLVLAVLGAWKKQIGGFVTVAVLVFVVSVHLMKPQDFIMYGICAGIGLVCALLSIKFHNFMLIASSVFGAMAAGSSIFYLQPYKNGMIHVALCVAIGALSIWIQLLLESGKRKKKNLLKAAEIREEHSTENEVEKARALVENLDDFDELDEIIESLPENVRKEDKGTTVVSMDEFDDLEDDLEEDEVENFKEEKFDVDEEDWEEDVEIEVTADEADVTEDYDFDEDPDDLDDLNDLDDLDYLDDDDDIEFLDEDE